MAKAPLQLKLPPPGVLVPNNAVDPLPHYYRPILGRVFAARLNTGLRLLDGHYRRLLEIGYGSGLLMPTLASACDELYGLDLEREPAGLRERLGRLGVRPSALVQANAQAMPFGDGFFDGAVAFSIFEHLHGDELGPALGEVARVLAPGGRLLVGCPAVHRLMNVAFASIGFANIEHHHFSDIAAVVAAAAPWFTVVERATLPSLMGALPLGWAPYTTVLFALSLAVDASFHAFEKEVEDWHWWYRVRRDILDQQLARLGLDPTRARILDVGCGTGGAALTLARHGRAVALDRSPGSFAIAMDRPYSHRVVASAAEPLPFADDSFDVVCALDILEHLDDDAAAARELERVCKPGGHVVAYVPAFQLLWGYNDEYSHHKRRYVKSELSSLLARAQLEIVESGYFNAVLFLPTLAARLIQRAAPRMTNGMEHSTKPMPWNGLLTSIFRAELPLLKRRPLPFGTSAYCIARKP